MPRRTLARRFEPRYGVSEAMIETEAKRLTRELDDYCLLSLEELRSRLAQGATTLTTTGEDLQQRMSVLPDRERLAVRCLIARDFWHLAMLYRRLLESDRVKTATGNATPRKEEMDKAEEPIPVVPFVNGCLSLNEKHQEMSLGKQASTPRMRGLSAGGTCGRRRLGC